MEVGTSECFCGDEIMEKGCTEAKSVKVMRVLFADDRTIVGEMRELVKGLREINRVTKE